MKRTRDDDASNDPITSDRWQSPQVLVNCGHVISATYLDKITSGGGLYACPYCRSKSHVIQLRTSCVFDSDADTFASDTHATAENKPMDLRHVVQVARQRRLGIYKRCMEALRGVLVNEISLHHWQSSLHPFLMEEPAFIFPFNKLRDRGVFQNATDFVVTTTYLGGAYRHYFEEEEIRITMWMERIGQFRKDNLKTRVSIADFKQDPQAFNIAIQYTCTAGYDGEKADLPKQ